MMLPVVVLWARDVLGLVGLTIVLTWSPLFGFFHKLYPKFFTCAMCVGFWTGFVGSWVCRLGTHVLDFLLTGFVVSLTSFATYLVLERLQISILNHDHRTPPRA